VADCGSACTKSILINTKMLGTMFNVDHCCGTKAFSNALLQNCSTMSSRLHRFSTSDVIPSSPLHLPSHRDSLTFRYSSISKGPSLIFILFNTLRIHPLLPTDYQEVLGSDCTSSLFSPACYPPLFVLSCWISFH